jgi:calpain-7
MVNPQYHLRIHPSTSVSAVKKSTTKVVLKAAKDVPVNVVAIWSQGDRKDEYVVLFVCLLMS